MGDMRVRLSTLWVLVLINMVYADIIGFMNPGDLESIISGDVGIKITQELLLVFSILLEIPIAMIVLARILSHRVNRWANIIAAVITILFIIGGGDTHLSYIFFASVEFVSLSFIIWYAWNWSNDEAHA